MEPKISFQQDVILYKYQLKRFIGGGHFGDVWLASDNQLLVDKAIKIFDSSLTPFAEFLKEARIGNRLDHSNLVKIDYSDIVTYDLDGVTKPYVIIAMDYYPKGSVVDILNSHNFLPITHAIKLILNVLSGLDYLHEKDVFHGDIKPNNILIGNTGEGILTDYGISCITNKLQPVPTTQFYYLHAAPETLKHSIFSVQTDIYQVGLTFFRLLNGVGTISTKLYSLGDVAFRETISNGKLILPRDYLPFVPKKLRSIIQKAIHNDVSCRYSTALEMRRDLEQLHYPGYWTTDGNGVIRGYLHNYTYSFDTIQSGKGVFNFTAHKENNTSKISKKVSVYCKKNVPNKMVEKVKSKFMQAVVQGTI